MTTAQPTVLIIEDEESFIDALEVGLRREGFLTRVAKDGPEALTLFDAVQPDLVLLDQVWGTDYVGDTKTLDVHVKRLRGKIETDTARPSLLTTIRGVGYRFESSAG